MYGSILHLIVFDSQRSYSCKMESLPFSCLRKPEHVSASSPERGGLEFEVQTLCSNIQETFQRPKSPKEPALVESHTAGAQIPGQETYENGWTHAKIAEHNLQLVPRQKINLQKTVVLSFSRKRKLILNNIYLNDVVLNYWNGLKYLRLKINTTITWKSHVNAWQRKRPEHFLSLNAYMVNYRV